MRYDLSKTENKKKVINRLAQIAKSNYPVVEVKGIRQKRTLNQNNYLHLLFSIYGLHFGYTTEEAKQQVKIDLGYYYLKNDYVFFRSTGKMDTKELSEFIKKFRNYSSYHGCYLPEADEITYETINIIEENKEFLEGAF